MFNGPDVLKLLGFEVMARGRVQEFHYIRFEVTLSELTAGVWHCLFTLAWKCLTVTAVVSTACF